jgi:hypothetical protein
VAVQLELIRPQDLQRVVVDTTVQHKAVAHPSDSRLLEVARRKLVEAAREVGIDLKQTFAKEGTALARQAARQALQEPLTKAQRIVAPSGQRKAVDGQRKLYAWHAPEVECIGKGKAKAPYEFGVKVGIVSTLHANLIVGARAFAGNPYDGHTLAEQLEQASILMQDCALKPTTAFVDLGYLGGGCRQPARAHRAPGQAQAHQPARQAAAQAPSGHRAHHRASEGRSPHGSLLPQGRGRRPAARGAVCGRVQHSLAAAHDCQEGAAGLVGVSFAPAAASGDGGKNARAALTTGNSGARVNISGATRYVWLYNHQLPQTALKGQIPLAAMRQWYPSHPHLFDKQPHDLPGLDIYP